MNVLSAYLDAWRRGDPDALAATLADGCVVVDQHGSLLRGRDGVADGLRQWLADGGAVHALTVSAQTEDQEVLTAHWVMDASWQGVRATVEGRSVAHLRDGVISYLRYYTGAALGDWDGTWQP